MRTSRTVHHAFSTIAAAALLAVGLSTSSVVAHCEIPCGIYGDEMRFDMIDEHLETISKSMRQIDELSKEPGKNANQLARWVMNKEDHAAQLREILTVYFLDQRIKPKDPGSGAEYKKYQAQVETLHRMMVQVMKCKQTTDLQHVENLRKLKKQLYELYFGKDHEKHTHQ
jgi:nickel superoxide dismutase